MFSIRVRRRHKIYEKIKDLQLEMQGLMRERHRIEKKSIK